MRRLIVLVFVAIGLVAIGAAPAQACEVEPAPRAQQLKTTPFVFSGVVTEAQPVSSEPGTTRYTVAVNRIYRGDVERTVTVSAPATVRDCGLRNVKQGTTLMFFAERADEDVLRTQSFMGTSRLTPRARKSVEAVIGKGTVPKRTDQGGDEDASGTVVDDSEPPSVTTAILPGVGLMVVGLLVLILARIFGRPVRP